MKNLRTALACIGMLVSNITYSQDNPPLGTLPMNYNGGFAGESGKGRLIVGANAIGEYFGDRYSFYGSYDHFFTKISTGVGLTAIGGYRDAYQLSISPKISFKGKYTFAPFVSVSYFDNEIGGSAGVLFNSQKFYMGYSLFRRSSIIQ